MAHLYYADSVTDVKPGERFTVTGDQARHAVTVARLRVGEQVLVGNTQGVCVTAKVLATEGGKQCFFTAEVLERQVAQPSVPQIVLVQALAKSGRDERAVELCTELGVDVIIPWQAARSVALWQGKDKQARGREKWQKVAFEASKQSLRAFVPKVTDVCRIADLQTFAADPRTLMLVLHPWEQQALTAVLTRFAAAGAFTADGETVAEGDLAAAAPEQATHSVQRVMFVVGPEGGISPEEVATLVAAGAHAGVIGQNVLRTSSAGAAALAVFNTLASRW